MLPRFRSPFKLEDKEIIINGESIENKCSKNISLAAGLQILVQISHGESNVLVKSHAISKSQPTSEARDHVQTKSLEYSRFLKTCRLCSKKLSPRKDVYMYRGDQGFCSVECRDSEVVLDEMREVETSTKQMLSPYHGHRCNSGRRETQILLQEFRQRHERA
ncbi:FCS-Like Zinc finger 17-like [Juglans microcarpa x Juglans regia]|uniref:FCS-Like Zinc finger 17-like n=1 Tax=Juglans microcarpa x Juglans regia TaxID=2249226 RepID=UPI001B7E80A2|nr:FCS-Like Zinc finger 17-like [Juglans microcarpa x Juglans regia]